MVELGDASYPVIRFFSVTHAVRVRLLPFPSTYESLSGSFFRRFLEMRFRDHAPRSSAPTPFGVPRNRFPAAARDPFGRGTCFALTQRPANSARSLLQSFPAYSTLRHFDRRGNVRALCIVNASRISRSVERNYSLPLHVANIFQSLMHSRTSVVVCARWWIKDITGLVSLKLDHEQVRLPLSLLLLFIVPGRQGMQRVRCTHTRQRTRSTCEETPRLCSILLQCPQVTSVS